MQDPVLRFALYLVGAIGLGGATFLVVSGLADSRCTDLDSDCDLGLISGIVRAVIAVVLVMPVVIAVVETWARYQALATKDHA